MTGWDEIDTSVDEDTQALIDSGAIEVCPACGEMSAHAWCDVDQDAADAMDRLFGRPPAGSVAHIPSSSAYEWVCGHCGRHLVESDSPINHPAYTHADPGLLRQDAQALIDWIWSSETRGQAGPAPSVADLPSILDDSGLMSFRRVVARLESYMLGRRLLRDDQPAPALVLKANNPAPTLFSAAGFPARQPEPKPEPAPVGPTPEPAPTSTVNPVQSTPKERVEAYFADPANATKSVRRAALDLGLAAMTVRLHAPLAVRERTARKPAKVAVPCCSPAEPEPCAACITAPQAEPAPPSAIFGKPEAVNRIAGFLSALTLSVEGKSYGVTIGKGWYTLDSPAGQVYRIGWQGRPGEESCDCPDARHRQHECKHVRALRSVGLLAPIKEKAHAL